MISFGQLITMAPVVPVRVRNWGFLVILGVLVLLTHHV